jgi:hypothetical protein
MGDIFLRSDAALDAAISECTDAERIREITKAHFAALGVISRERGNDWGARVIGQQPAQTVPLTASGYRYEREVKFHESTGRRTLFIRANTLEELNELEQQVTS